MQTRVGSLSLLLVAIILVLPWPSGGTQDDTPCQGDFNGDERVSIDELVRAVNNALYGCGTRAPTPAPTLTDTPTATPSYTTTATASATCAPEEEVCNGRDDNCDCAGDTNGDNVVCGPGDDGVDEGGVCGLQCPADMVAIGSEFCMDTYEASRPDATAFNAGANESSATSRPGVLPWMVNPVNRTHLQRFQNACQAAGKRLCTGTEWLAACQGPPPGTTYVFGNTFNRETCNCVDTFCDDYCSVNGILPGSCNIAANCGYAYSCFHVAPTASFPQCTNAYGTFDINGNVWEVVPSQTDPRGYEVRGGAFNCASASARLQCTYNAGWDDLYAGFRCCYAP
jgi:formylglycine-generating enzyme